MADEEDIDYSQVDWEEQESEIEALEVIFPDEFTILAKKPFKFEIMINSNSESAENHLQMLLIVELPHDYPNTIPDMRLKNKSPKYLDNRMIDEYECQMRAKAHESVGMQMIFEICEHLREQIGDINDKVLTKFNEVQKKIEEQEIYDAGPKTSNMEDLDYTPVNEETFGKWCAEFLNKLKEEEENNKTEQDLRPTGKEIFMQMVGQGDIDDLTLDDEEADELIEETLELEEIIQQEEQQRQGALYDKNLFAEELGAEEDVDFD